VEWAWLDYMCLHHEFYDNRFFLWHFQLWYRGICVCSRPCYVFVCVCEYGMSAMYVVWQYVFAWQVDDQAIESMPMETMKEGSSRSKTIHSFHQRQDCIISYWKIISIPKELEYLQILVKFTRKWNENLKSSNIIRTKRNTSNPHDL
jgi:hypothetical protein